MGDCGKEESGHCRTEMDVSVLAVRVVAMVVVVASAALLLLAVAVRLVVRAALVLRPPALLRSRLPRPDLGRWRRLFRRRFRFPS